MTTTTSTYLAVNQNLSRYQSMIASEPAVKTATAYYTANIGSVTSISQFVGNYRLLSYALQAYGLGDQVNSKALVTKVLEGGVSSSKALANNLSNPNWAKFAAAFDFVPTGEFGFQIRLEPGRRGADARQQVGDEPVGLFDQGQSEMFAVDFLMRPFPRQFFRRREGFLGFERQFFEIHD